MSDPSLTVAAVNTSGEGGGAARMAADLADGLRARGHRATLLVGRGEGSPPHVHAFPDTGATALLHRLSGLGRWVDRRLGRETFHYPATSRMLDVLDRTPDLIHLHNLHGGYFDLRVLPSLSRRYPVALTLHDAWLLSGHCAHSLGCARWRTGCGSCPDLDIYPSVRRDATARNWQRKRAIFARSRLFVATPSDWLADKVRASMLAPAVDDLRVIANGVDRGTFRPGARAAARRELGLDPDDLVVMAVAGAPGDRWFKDPEAAVEAASTAAQRLQRTLTLLVLGGADSDRTNRPSEHLHVRHLAYRPAAGAVARLQQAADLYLHAARADTFPSTVIEALACGTPVVASAVGGVPEQVRSLEGPGVADAYTTDQATGVLAPPDDTTALAAGLERLLADEALRHALGANAARDAAARFDREGQVTRYEAWFHEVRALHAEPWRATR